MNEISPRPPPIAWDIRATRAIGVAMGTVTIEMWQQKKGTSPWFVFGGCLFWLVIIYLVAAFYMIKVALYLAIEAVLLAALLGVWCVSGPQRLWRAIRRPRPDDAGPPAIEQIGEPS
jgi:hypothetical protein